MNIVYKLTSLALLLGGLQVATLATASITSKAAVYQGFIGSKTVQNSPVTVNNLALGSGGSNEYEPPPPQSQAPRSTGGAGTR